MWTQHLLNRWRRRLQAGADDAQQKSPPTAEDAESQAAAWVARMRSDARTPAVEGQFHRWLAQDPLHELAYRDVERMWGSFGALEGASAIETLRRAARMEGGQEERARLRMRSRRHAVAAFASLAAVAVTLLLWTTTQQERTYATAVGDRQTVQLSDGSEVTLNTDTMLRVRYRLWSRQIVLDRGQAHFKVKPSLLGPLRPFLVEASNGVVRAVGTEFDVYYRGADLQVTLLEGKIEVTDTSGAASLAAADQAAQAAYPADPNAPQAAAKRLLVAGQHVAVTAQGVLPIEPANLAKTNAWMAGLLQFDNERLQDAVAEVNRYSTTKLVVVDKQLADLRLSGVFRSGGVESFVSTLRASFGVKTVEAADGTLILMPEEGAAR